MQAPRERRSIASIHSWPRLWVGVSGQPHARTAIYPRGTHWIGGWVGLRSCLRKNPLPLSGIEPRSSSLYSDTILAELPQLLYAIRVFRTEHYRQTTNCSVNYPTSETYRLMLVISDVIKTRVFLHCISSPFISFSQNRHSLYAQFRYTANKEKLFSFCCDKLSGKL
jgi:hypothetical protein